MSERAREALLLDQITAALRPRVKELTTYLEEHPEASLADVEQEVKRLNHGLWATALAQVMIWRRKDVEYEVLCPQCGARAEPKGSQEREQKTLVGRCTGSGGITIVPLAARGTTRQMRPGRSRPGRAVWGYRRMWRVWLPACPSMMRRRTWRS